MSKNQTIAIDGRAKTGKSTVAQLLAIATGFNYLNSGWLYRSVGFLRREHNVPLDDHAAIAKIAQDLKFETVRVRDVFRAHLEDQDLTEVLSGDEVGQLASEISGIEPVRLALRHHQLEARTFPGLVAEGRDMGEIFEEPNVIRFFLTATPRTRALRILASKSGVGDLDALINQIEIRDRKDTTRAVSPLRKHERATLIATDEVSAEEVAGMIRKAFAADYKYPA